MTPPNAQHSVLQADQLDLLRRTGHQRSFPSGATIFAEGGRPEFALIIERGRVKVVTKAENGYTSVIGLRGAGDLIGEDGCIDGAPRSASVIALTPVTATLIPSSRFRQVLNKRIDILQALLAITIRRVRESDRRLLEHSAYPAVDRTVRVLLDLAEQYGEPVEGNERSVSLLTYQRDLAGAAGVSRETVVRTIRNLTERGVISTTKGRIVIHDLDLLRALVSRGPL